MGEGGLVLLLRDKRLGIPAMVFAFLIAFSRMYQYAHYPTDILGGMIVGCLCAVAAYFIVKHLWDIVVAKFSEKRQKN